MAKKKTKKVGLFINGKFDYTLIIITLLLLSIGLIMLLSASAPTSLSETDGENSYKYVFKQGHLICFKGILSFYILAIEYEFSKSLNSCGHLLIISPLASVCTSFCKCGDCVSKY